MAEVLQTTREHAKSEGAERAATEHPLWRFSEFLRDVPIRVLPGPAGAHLRVAHEEEARTSKVKEDDALRLARQYALDFLLYEMAREALPKMASLRACALCERLMIVGGAFGRRRDAKFCSQSCKDKARASSKKVRG